MNQVRITSEGIGIGTKIVDENSGLEINGITGVDISIAVNSVNKAVIELSLVAMDVRAQAEYVIVHPVTNQIKTIKSIEFHDGEVLILQQGEHYGNPT